MNDEHEKARQVEEQQSDTAVPEVGEMDADAAVLGDLDEVGTEELDLTPESAIADSLHSALRTLREEADGLERAQLDDATVDAAEQVAERAAELDEQIGSVARSDDD